MNFIKRWLIKRAILKSATTKKKESSIYDDVLKSEIARSTEVNRMADKVLKAKLLRQQSDATLRKIQELDEDFEDDDEAPQEAQGLEDQIGAALIQKLLGGGALQNNTGFIKEGALGPSGTPEELEKKAQDAGIPQDTINKFKEKFFDVN